VTSKPFQWRDYAWKMAIVSNLPDALKYFKPDLVGILETSTGTISSEINKEIPINDGDSTKGMTVTDILVNIPVKKRNTPVACLIELQHENNPNLHERIINSYIRLRAQRRPNMVTAFVIYTGKTKNVNYYTETYLETKTTVEFKTFHIPSYNVETLRADDTVFGRVMYAGYRSFEIGDDLASREKYGWELLNLANDKGYNDLQKLTILNFSRRIFWLDDANIDPKLQEAYTMTSKPLRDIVYENELQEREEVGIIKGKKEGKKEGIAEGIIKGKKEVALNLIAQSIPVDTIILATGLDENFILSLK
jgi:hypothetical protein